MRINRHQFLLVLLAAVATASIAADYKWTGQCTKCGKELLHGLHKQRSPLERVACKWRCGDLCTHAGAVCTAVARIKRACNFGACRRRRRRRRVSVVSVYSVWFD